MAFTIKSPADSEPRHAGSYPTYHALWHLERLGVVTDLTRFSSPDAWGKVASGNRKTRVALIDTSVDMTHPCLAPAVNRGLAIDFAARDLGVFTIPRCDLSGAEAQARAGVIADAGAAAGSGDGTRDRFLRDLGQAHATQEGARAAAAGAFSGHGTSMAGLIGARPASGVYLHRPARLSPQPRDAGESEVALPYAGIDPFCEIVPISTSAMPNADQMTAALAYADLIAADLVVLASALPDPTRAGVGLVPATPPDTGMVPVGQTATGAEAVPSDAATLAAWDALDAAFIDLSSRRLLLCAAGNAGDGLIAYPANLAAPDNGIMAVGACTSDGLRASYSAGEGEGQAVTLFALSGDAPAMDAADFRLDPFAEIDNADQKALFDRKGASPVAVETLITTDVAGRPGYSSSAFGQVWRDTPGPGGAPVAFEFASFFCEFSGTSAATAVAAGLISLGFSAGRLDRATPPSAIKAALTGGQPYDGARGLPMLTWESLNSVASA
ncbi:S8 family serine peptidase [Oceaniglobus trochenteri]|uniref:S8 family serine peptidase n=1 Tax=Oceaniglobus trochenteri TaxID=2763260 RepID=UPI001CFFB1EB|nr:S8 family serine peptidase [Oceaniglobus trochenteri]